MTFLPPSNSCLNFTCILPYSHVVKCDEFLALSKHQVVEIISSDHLTTTGEDKVCDKLRKHRNTLGTVYDFNIED